jgi:hypothetical protein
MAMVDGSGSEGSMDRRRFLKRTLFGAAALMAARFLPAQYGHAGIPQSVSSRLTFFSDEEYLIVATVSSRLTGHPMVGSLSEKDIDVALRADHFLSTEDPELQEQFHLLLTLFNSAVVAAILEFTFSRFLNMQAEVQDEYLESWMTSSIGFRRTAFQALKRLCMSMHYTDSRSSGEIGYHGMFLPEERR